MIGSNEFTHESDKFNEEAYFTCKAKALLYASNNISNLHSFMIKQDTNVLNINDISNNDKLISALRKVTGLWDVEVGLKKESEGLNPYLFGSMDRVEEYISLLLEDSSYSHMSKHAILSRILPFREMLLKGNAPTIKNPGRYYELVFRLAFGIDEKQSWRNILHKPLKVNLLKFISKRIRFSFGDIDHELMYAICKVLLNVGIAGYGAPYLRSFRGGYLIPEIMFCQPHDVLLPVSTSEVHISEA